MLQNQIQFSVLIKNRPITEYLHEGETFVEGREGSNFVLRVSNHSNERVEAIISVDGLSILDGKSAGTNSSGYLIDPRGTIDIPGWKLNEDQVAAFVFSGKKTSYATVVTGEESNNGVIGIMAFKEQPKRQAYRGYMRMASAFPQAGSAADMIVGASVATSSTSPFDIARYYSGNDLSLSADDADTQNLGTGFGEAEIYQTEEVQFERGAHLTTMVMYYDNAAGLRRRGIELRQKPAKPNAFPATEHSTGCVPPPNWNPNPPKKVRGGYVPQGNGRLGPPPTGGSAIQKK